MNTPTEREVQIQAGFSVYKLRTETLEIAVVPELGARVISLLNKNTGREWMWHPKPELALFPNSPGDDFSLGTLAGADECIPTIAPCNWQGRDLPDHGEAWSAAWDLDQPSWLLGKIRTTLTLPVSPLRIDRTITVSASRVHMSYLLFNLGSRTEKFLWALHPLIRFTDGDRLDLPASARRELNPEPWLDDLTLCPLGGCSKLFAGPLQECRAGVRNARTGDSLEFQWTGSQNKMLGLWLTRGGWNGHHHLAIEPTNGAPDSLSEAAADDRCGFIAAGQSLSWEISINLQTNYDQKSASSVVLPDRLRDSSGSRAYLDLVT